jgi:hypothetical protein
MKTYTFAFSAINLFFLPVWFVIFNRRGIAFFNDAFVANHLQIPAIESFDYAAGIVTVVGLSLLLGTILYLFKTYWKTLHDWFVAGLVITLVLYGANIIRIFYIPTFNRVAIIQLYEETGIIIVFGVIVMVLIGLFFITKYLPQLSRLVLIGLPISFVIFANALIAIYMIGEKSIFIRDVPLAEIQSKKPNGYRVVWIIFDEFDYRLGFEKRPGDLDLKYFDKISGRAFIASQALPPANGTFPSIPSLLIGNSISSAVFDDHDVTIEQNKSSGAIKSSWRSLPNIFSDLRDRGFNAMAIGQDYIPYCRILGNHMSGCIEFNNKWPPSINTALQYVPKFVTKFLTFIPLLNRQVAPQLFDPGWPYKSFLQKTKNYFTNPKYDLVYAHWAVPHTPYVYDRKSRKYAYKSEVPKNYFDNMALADLLLKEMINSILKSNVATRTAVIISSDHHWRRAKDRWDGIADFRVPFIVLLPESKQSHKYENTFNTVLTKSLVEAMIAGRIKNYQDISDFIKSRTATVGKLK